MINYGFTKTVNKPFKTMLEITKNELKRDTIEKNIVVGVGGFEEAMRELLKPQGAWKAEVGIAVREAAEKSYEVLSQMINKEIPIKTKKEYLIPSDVFISPSLEQVQEYLKVNHDIKDFAP